MHRLSTDRVMAPLSAACLTSSLEPTMRGKWLGNAFSWTDHVRCLLGGRPTKPRERALLNAAQHADWCLRHDKSGYAGPLWLAHLFQLLHRSRLARYWRSRSQTMLSAQRQWTPTYLPLQIPRRSHVEICALTTKDPT